MDVRAYRRAKQAGVQFDGAESFIGPIAQGIAALATAGGAIALDVATANSIAYRDQLATEQWGAATQAQSGQTGPYIPGTQPTTGYPQGPAPVPQTFSLQSIPMPLLVGGGLLLLLVLAD